MIVYTGRDPDKQDLPDVGGSKTKVLPQISPFVATNVSDTSIEDLRLSVEKQLREVADVTRNILILIDKTKEQLSQGVIDLKNHLEEEIHLLDERVHKLENP